METYDLELYLKFNLTKVPFEAELAYERFLYKAKAKAKKDEWWHSVYIKLLEAHRDTIVRFYRDFISVANHVPDRGSMGDIENYDH
jgi:hypothetical protein